jgi:hypothetical protein
MGSLRYTAVARVRYRYGFKESAEMYFLKPGDRIIIDLGNDRFGLEAVNLLGERVGLVSGLTPEVARRALGPLAYQDHGRVWACHHAKPHQLRPLNRN